MKDHLTAMYVEDLTSAADTASLSFNTVRALEVIGHRPELIPDMAFSAWALATAAKARRLELSELWPGLFRPMIAMGAVVTEPSYRTVAQLGL